jgi:AraC-like DNA-binding protein
VKIIGLSFYRTTTAGQCWHAHGHYQLHFVVSGTGAYDVNDHGVIDVRAGTFFVIPPDRTHRIVLAPAMPLLSEYLIGMQAEDQNDPVRKLLDNELGRLRAFTDVAFNLKFFEVKREQLRSGNPYERQAAALGLFSWLYALCARHFATANPLAPERREDAVELGLEVLQHHIEKVMDLTMLARRVGINRFSLVRNFSRQLGVTPMKYFLRIKLESAAVMLRESNLTVSEIADRLCFSDPFYFSKRFKILYAVSPARYRIQARNTIPSHKTERGGIITTAHADTTKSSKCRLKPKSRARYQAS